MKSKPAHLTAKGAAPKDKSVAGARRVADKAVKLIWSGSEGLLDWKLWHRSYEK